MDYMQGIKEWLDSGKVAIDLLKSAASLLPKGEKRTAIEGQLVVAETTMQANDAKLALDLGMKLCDCRFPPNIMLWRQAEDAHVCPNPACGRKKFAGMRISNQARDAFAMPKGRDGWMAK